LLEIFKGNPSRLGESGTLGPVAKWCGRLLRNELNLPQSISFCFLQLIKNLLFKQYTGCDSEKKGEAPSKSTDDTASSENGTQSAQFNQNNSSVFTVSNLMIILSRFIIWHKDVPGHHQSN